MENSYGEHRDGSLGVLDSGCYGELAFQIIQVTARSSTCRS